MKAQSLMSQDNFGRNYGRYVDGGVEQSPTNDGTKIQTRIQIPMHDRIDVHIRKHERECTIANSRIS